MTRRALLPAALLALAAGCGEGTVIEVDPIPADVEDWYRVDTTGAIPGHGDSYRIIYANDEARLRTQSGTYPGGSIIVKEVRHFDASGEGPGDLRYYGIMRKLGDAPDGAELHAASPLDSNGWLFTYLGAGEGAEEEYRESCWSSCHVAAPIDGAFLDYGE